MRKKMVMRDRTYCTNMDCSKRKECFRALENYSNQTKKGSLLLSYSSFNCK